MIKAEINKFEAQQRQIQKIKENFFPMGELQERVENFMPYYAKWGRKFLKMIWINSLALEQRFCVLEEGEE